MRTQIQGLLREYGPWVIRICLILMLIVGGVIAVSRLFSIESVVVKGEGVAAVVNPKKIGGNLLLFSGGMIRKSVLAENPLIADIVFHKEYPHTLVIEVMKRKPIARLISSSWRVLLDRDGVVLPDDEKIQVPELQFPVSPVHEGAPVSNKHVSQVLAFLTLAPSLLPISHFTYHDSTSIRATSGKTSILFTQDVEMTALITTLQTLIEGFRIKGTLPTTIDLRFNKPVVTF